MNEIALSIAMIAFFLLAGGGALMIVRRDYKRGVLMIIAALVIAGNVAIWSMPVT